MLLFIVQIVALILGMVYREKVEFKTNNNIVSKIHRYIGYG